MATVRELKEWLDRLPDDAEVRIIDQEYESDLELPEIVDPESDYIYGLVHYDPPREAWTFVPTEEARSRGEVERAWPRFPGQVVLGQRP